MLRFDWIFAQTISRRLVPTDALLINRYTSVVAEDELVQAFPVEVGPWRSPLRISQGTIKRLLTRQALTTDDVTNIIPMFMWRNCYLEDLSTRDNQAGWTSSSFYMLNSTCRFPVDGEFDRNIGNSYCLIYIEFSKLWALAVLNHEIKKCDIVLPNTGAGSALMKTIVWNTLYAANIAYLGEWSLVDSLGILLLGQLSAEEIPEEDRALALLYILYSLILLVPVYFECDDFVQKYRENFAYYLTKGNLPF